MDPSTVAANAAASMGAGGASATAGGMARPGSGPGRPGGAGAGNPSPLRPGMFARVNTVFSINDAALVVPEESIVPQGGPAGPAQWVHKPLPVRQLRRDSTAKAARWIRQPWRPMRQPQWMWLGRRVLREATRIVGRLREVWLAPAVDRVALVVPVRAILHPFGLACSHG